MDYLRQGEFVEIYNKSTGKKECWAIVSPPYHSMEKAIDVAENGIANGDYSTEWTDTYKHISRPGKSFPSVTRYYVIERDFESERLLNTH